MPSWNAEQYLRYERERTQPCIDLAARISLKAPRLAVDLGCGPGNSTAVVGRRFPDAKLRGVDSSPAMLDRARRDYPQYEFQEADVRTWTVSRPCDLIFSNAVLQWLDGHEDLLPRLLSQLAAGGALALQIPCNFDSAPHVLQRNIAESAAWAKKLSVAPRFNVLTPARYYEILAPRCERLELWETAYIHLMDGLAGVVEWYRGTGLRPYLDQLAPGDQTLFCGDYARELAGVLPVQADGKVLFPFRRLFLVAYSPS